MAKARLVDSLGGICRYAASKGNIVIELEQFGSYEPRRATGGESRASGGRRDFGWARGPLLEHSLIGPTQEAVEIAQELRRHHRNFGLLIDLSHLPLLNERPRRAVNIAGEFLAHAHIGNCVRRNPSHPAYGDRHPVFGIPGGENDVPEIKEFLAGLMDIAFLEKRGERILSFEVKPFGNQTTKEVVSICKTKLDEAWRRL
jgi:sugar phosphate isomerase/epimerase